MRLRIYLAAVLLASLSPSQGQTFAPQVEEKLPAPSARTIALENLLSERDSDQALEKAIFAAREAGINDQVILEARFLYHVDRREDDAIAAMLPEFLKKRETFKVTDSEIFSVTEDWLAVVEYVQAIHAMKKGDKAGFKQHITEAFWLSPRQGSAFASDIERMRMDEAMRMVKVDFTTSFPSMSGNEPVLLEKMMVGKKALLLHFWSPLSRECEVSMPDFITTAKHLESSGVPILSLLPNGEPELLADAKKLLETQGSAIPGMWAVENKEAPVGPTLRIQNLPAVVLVSAEGKVLFNGQPSDDAFWESLAKVDPKITRPEIPKTTEGE